MIVSKIAAFLALAVLAVRSAVRLELRWDTFWYHIPFAALRGGLPVPYEMSEFTALRYQGFPPLPNLVQGVLWRLSGSINATGVVNYLAFCLFLAHCHLLLGARAWLVTLISLTAPLVLIHMTSSYVDLFGNSFLAIALSSCLFLFLFPARTSWRVLVGALVGAVAAAWSKYQLAPIASLVFPFLLLHILRPPATLALSSARRAALLIALATLLAALPYVKNTVVYGNPVWPIQSPVFSDLIAFGEARNPYSERPARLRDHSQFSLFIHSLLEIDHPTSYEYRPRWLLDQGNAEIAFRSGGFWVIGTIFYLFSFCALLLLRDRRSGLIAAGGVSTLVCLVSLLPQAHELRYYLFLPLVWSAGIGMLFSVLEERAPLVAPLFLGTVLGLFSFMVWENRPYYRIEHIGYREAADYWGASQWWPRLKSGELYCAVEMAPAGILLTGPTMTEFRIVERSKSYLCPFPSIILKKDGTQSPLTAETLLNEGVRLHEEGRFPESLLAASRARELRPDYALAANNACAANIALKKWQSAIDDCTAALALDPDLQRAKNNLAWAIREGQGN